MEFRDFIISGFNDAHRMVDFAMEDLTPEVAHFEAGGKTNNIAQLLVHVTLGADRGINSVIKGGQMILESEDWYAKTGIPEGRGAFWQKGWTLDLGAFTEYREKVKASLTDFVASMDVADLDREVEWFTGPRPVSNILQIVLMHHILGHAGEMSALKGVQGLKGLPL